MGQCIYIKSDSTPCEAMSITNSEYCFWHSQDSGHLEASSKGGRQGKRTVLSESNLSLRSTDDLIELLERTLNQVLSGELDKGVGNTAGYLAGVLLKVIDQGELEKRLDALEERVEQNVVRRIQ